MDTNNSQCSCHRFDDQWLKGKIIGSGSFGSVYLAMNKATGSLFVVKSAESGAGVQSLKNEAAILESLNSPYVVKCLGRDFENNGDDRINIFMEYMAGGSIWDVAEKFGGALDAEVIRLYTRGILHGLKYLHDNGIVHCDLKCKNVLLGLNGDVKLADFGCAKRVKGFKGGELSNSWQSIGGTPLWMAPEVLRNEGLDLASDIWSLGCLVIEMATGKPPWGDKVSNPVSAVLKIACSNEKPGFPKDFCKEGLDFLTKCLQRNPKERLTADELLKHPFISGISTMGNNNSSITNSTKQCASCSPSSTLDFRMCEREYYDSDESNSSTIEDELPCRNPFSTRYCFNERNFGQRNRMVCNRQQETGSEFESSEDWITVR